MIELPPNEEGLSLSLFLALAASLVFSIFFIFFCVLFLYDGKKKNEMSDFTMETREASPAHLLIKIESFSLLLKRGIEKYESRDFEAGDYKWRLIIHFGGLVKTENEDDHISVYLAIVNDSSMPMGWEVNANFSIFMYNQILDNYLCFQGKTRRFDDMKSEWGFSKLISKERLRAPSNGFLVDDNFVFGAEVSVVKPQRIVERISVLKTIYSCKRDWTISDFSTLGRVWYSEEFVAGDHKWKIELHPNGDQGQKGQSVSMYLLYVDSKKTREKVKADFHMRIKDQLNDQHQSINDSKWFLREGWGWPAFIPVSDMRDPNKGFVVKDRCIVEVEITVQAVVRENNP